MSTAVGKLSRKIPYVTWNLYLPRLDGEILASVVAIINNESKIYYHYYY